MNKQLVKDAFGLGLCPLAYRLRARHDAFRLRTRRPHRLGHHAIGTIIALWVSFRKVNGDTFRHYCLVALVWTLIAVVGDYLFIVKTLKPADGYYKLDVYLYYALTLAIPLFAGWRRTLRRTPSG